MKLNLGCGGHKRPGWVNVDIEAACDPDAVVDLERTPWPWGDDSVTEVLMSHVLEHLGATTSVFLGIMRELYRVCADGAVVVVHVPHPRHDQYLADPTHVRPILPETLAMFSRSKCLEWRDRGVANTPLALYLDVDFETTRVNMHLDDAWLERANTGQLTRPELEHAVNSYANVVKQIDIELTVRKSDALRSRERDDLPYRK